MKHNSFVVMRIFFCGSSKILTWTGKYKLGAIVGARVGKYNLGTRAGKWIIFGQGQ